MIENASSMDRVVVTPRAPKPVVIVVALVVAGASAALFPAVRRWTRAERSVDASTVRIASVTRGDLVRELSVEGRVVASLSPTLFSRAQGIVSLRTHAGFRVRRGEVLAVIDSKELHATLDQARSQLLTARAELDRERIVARQSELRLRQQSDLADVKLAAAKRQLERVQRTFKEGLSNQVDLETAQDNVRISEMERAQAASEVGLSAETLRFEIATREQQVTRDESVASELQKRVDDLTILAPFDGEVAAVAVQDRDAVAPNQAIVTVVNLSSLELQIGLPEEYANETAVGTPATITFLGRDYPGKVTRVSPEVLNSEVAATVAFAGEQPQGLKQNQRLTARLTFESKPNVLKVPRGAFIEAEGGRAAYVVDGDLATRRSIATGATSVSEVEVVSGLRDGEKIVVSDTAPFGHAKSVLLR